MSAWDAVSHLPHAKWWASCQVELSTFCGIGNLRKIGFQDNDQLLTENWHDHSHLISLFPYIFLCYSMQNETAALLNDLDALICCQISE